MSQHDMVLDNADGAAFRADLNNALLALAGNSSGSAAPATTYPYEFWADTTTGLLKLRNAANSAWITVGTLASANLGHAASGANSDVTSMTALTAATVAANPARAGDIQKQTYTAFTTGGTGTAFTLTPTPAITAYTAGQEWDISFHAAAGAAPTLAISGVATPPNLVKQNTDGTYTNIAANDFPSGWQSKVKLLSATQALVRDLSRVAASTTISGIVELATDAEAQALADTTRPIVPSTLAAALQGANQSISTLSYQKLPGGLILQFGTTASIGINASAATTFPLAFPSSCLAVVIAPITSGTTSQAQDVVSAISLTSFTTKNNGNAATAFYFIAIGI